MGATAEKKAEIVAAVAAHFRRQGGPALGLGRTCRYLAPDGRRCAIGALLTEDELRDKDVVRNMAVDDIPDAIKCRILDVASLSSLSPDDRAFLKDIQRVHDRASAEVRDERDTDDWRPEFDASWLERALKKLESVAIKHGLGLAYVGQDI